MNWRAVGLQVSILVTVAVVIGLTVNSLRKEPLPWRAEKLSLAGSIQIGHQGTSPVLLAVSLEQAQELFKEHVVFIDAREPAYYQESHIPGAWNIESPFELVFKLDSLQGKDAPLVVYCGDEGCGSSEELAYTLQEFGFNEIYVFTGGWKDWVKAGLPIE